MDYHNRGPDQAGPPRYVMLSDHGSGSTSTLRPPPQRRNLPRYHSHPAGGSRHNACGCRCLCWCCFCLLLFIILTAVAIFCMYLIFDPKIPTYTIDNLSITSLDFQPNFTLHARLSVSVRSVNPNNMIGISYRSGSEILVLYRKNKLCSGHLPSFYQGHRNTTIVKVAMEGKAAFSSNMLEALQENREKGRIPLDVHVKAPIVLRLGDVDMRQFRVVVDCNLIVDNLSPNKKAGIKSAEYEVNVEF